MAFCSACLALSPRESHRVRLAHLLSTFFYGQNVMIMGGRLGHLFAAQLPAAVEWVWGGGTINGPNEPPNEAILMGAKG